MKDVLLNCESVCSILNVSPTTLWRMRREGVFPNPIKIPGFSSQGWLESTVEKWISDNLNPQHKENENE